MESISPISVMTGVPIGRIPDNRPRPAVGRHGGPPISGGPRKQFRWDLYFQPPKSRGLNDIIVTWLSITVR